MKHILAALGLLILAAATAVADDDVRSKPLTLHPAPPSSAALKFALLPELRDTIPGNAVPHYRQAVKNMKQDAPPQRDWYPLFDQWLAAPLKDLPREEMSKFLKQCESTFQEMEAGARSEQCDWGITEELRKKGFETLLPDVQNMRAIAALFTIRIRYELAEGRPDKATRTLQTGFALSRHLADAPTLISALVGMAVASLMLERLEEVMQQPDAPNFYWALTDLPRPFIDLRKPMQGERVSAYGSFPGMTEMAADLNAKPWTPEQVEKVVRVLKGLSMDTGDAQEIKAEVEVLLRLAARHEAAKKALVDQGRPKDLVDAMPHVQVGLLVALQEYDRQFDEMAKWQSLPFWEAEPGMAKAEERRKETQDDKTAPAIPLAKVFMPAVKKVFAARTRTDRRIAALRCVEGVRLYATAHEGKLPSSLDDVKEVPLPNDPVDGKPFGLRLVGDRAFFVSKPFPGQPAINATTPTYELIWKP